MRHFSEKPSITGKNVDIAANLKTIQEKIRKAERSANRAPESVQLLAVSKTRSPEEIREAFNAGQILFGENYIQEALTKEEKLADLPISWHFVGHLQSNKARFAVKFFDLIHSVDSFKLAAEIGKQAAKGNKIQKILVQVRLGDEKSKSGIAPESLASILNEIKNLSNISVEGLMTVPPPVEEAEENRIHFRRLRELMEEANAAGILPAPMATLSMGMTDDFEVAVSEGATLVRIGTAIFGARS